MSREGNAGGVRPPGGSRDWLRSARPVPRLVVRPLERFLRLESGSASLLMGAALIALIWSNVSVGSYDEFWTTRVTLEFGGLRIEEDVQHLVNELLMAIFFFVIALEVKREALFGSLRDPASASVPVAAALGTMVGAALTYLVFNIGGGETRGWAIPIATDIAFALGALGLLGDRVPRELRAFMLTLAVVDDVGTILVIAVFYSAGISASWLAAAALLILAVILLQRLSVRLLMPYVALAGVIWLAVYESGIHATIAGVILGFLTPARPLYPREPTGETIAAQLNEISDSADAEIGQATMLDTARLAREAVSPLERMERQLHPWSAYLILPVFALANAGVPISLAQMGDALTSPVGLGIVVGLVVGAPLGGFAFAWTLARATPARLPDGLDWQAIAGVAPLKGIGFTVAIFIAVLAFDDPALQDEAKLAVLIASVIAAIIGTILLYIRHRVLRREDGAAEH